MRAVIVMFDSLNREMLEPYGCQWTQTPNFSRLARRTTRFNKSYVCSMPCMPARRDFLTGRPNFLHRAWGPIEPFDDSMPDLLRQAGVYSHLSTDHQHYWEDGGCTYHTRYSSFDLVRGQEGDPWIGQVQAPPPPDREIPRTESMVAQDVINRQFTGQPEKFPLNVTFRKGLDFIRRNHQSDRWMLQIETFDPHEPFFSLEEDRKKYAEHFSAYNGKPVEWPPYRKVQESDEVVEHARYEYAALVSACDRKLGEVLDIFDELSLWEDTMLIVWTDHGFLLGEHESWGKCWAPFYNEIARTPFFMWDPRHPSSAGHVREALVQPSIDLPVTLLKFFDVPPTEDMLGRDLEPCIANDEDVRDFAIFGLFGGHVNITDGNSVYMRGPVNVENQPLYEYTLMPTRMRRRFTPEELRCGVTLSDPLSFTKRCPVLKIPIKATMPGGEPIKVELPTLLFRLSSDPRQESPLTDLSEECRLTLALARELALCSAPPEQYERLGMQPC